MISNARRAVESRIPDIIPENEPIPTLPAITDLPMIERPVPISPTSHPTALSSDIASSSRSRISTADNASLASAGDLTSSVDYDDWYRSVDTDFDFADPADIFAHRSTQHFDVSTNANVTPRSYSSWVIDKCK